MAEMKVTHVLIGLVVVGAIAVVVLAFSGYVAIGFLNKKDLNKLVDQGAATVSGYTPAKTPTEAMDKFREAILARKYKFAASYCTKPYAEQLERAHEGASHACPGPISQEFHDRSRPGGGQGEDQGVWLLHV
jgi:hypothetical protein